MNKSSIVVALFLLFIACKNSNDTQKGDKDTLEQNGDTIIIDTFAGLVDTSISKQPVYENQRFRNVTITKTGPITYQVKGKAQVFEASFGWLVEDGHNLLKEGYTTTDAGAPEFGNFSFEVSVAKQRKNSTLTLILFEPSAKDGSRQHLLPIPLPTQ